MQPSSNWLTSLPTSRPLVQHPIPDSQLRCPNWSCPPCLLRRFTPLPQFRGWPSTLSRKPLHPTMSLPLLPSLSSTPPTVPARRTRINVGAKLEPPKNSSFSPLLRRFLHPSPYLLSCPLPCFPRRTVTTPGSQPGASAFNSIARSRPPTCHPTFRHSSPCRPPLSPPPISPLSTPAPAPLLNIRRYSKVPMPANRNRQPPSRSDG